MLKFRGGTETRLLLEHYHEGQDKADEETYVGIRFLRYLSTDYRQW